LKTFCISCTRGKHSLITNRNSHRDVIRSTWGSEKLVEGQEVRLFFLLGMQTGDDAQQVHQQLLQESKEHHDLIQSDFVDCYKNLTIKTMVMLEWLNSFCSSAPFAMKIDSDMFLNVPNLVALLLKAPRTNYMTGLVAHGGQVLRNPSSKWYMPVDLVSDAYYPPYALGLGYILSLDLTKKLIQASRHVKALYIEDVYLGFCMKHLGILPTDPPNGFYFHVFPRSYSRCDYSRLIKRKPTHAWSKHTISLQKGFEPRTFLHQGNSDTEEPAEQRCRVNISFRTNSFKVTAQCRDL
uniref:Hexosyltransferase n=1 Tax=Fundulus heteroclitus TaxID=8078 RepID=A0A3Q2QEL3_FUNHE